MRAPCRINAPSRDDSVLYNASVRICVTLRSWPMKICHTCQQTYSDDVEFCPREGARLAAQATETEAQLAGQLSRRFRIVRRLGAGAMGTVLLAEQIAVGNRPVALKVLNRKLLDDPDFLLRFQNEAASTGRIHHANVVTIYESGQGDDGTPYIAMEFLEGESLRQTLARRGALPVPEVADILQQAARGLNAAHKLGIIHRDLKPDNIFLTRGDEGETIVKIVDFGIAKLRESSAHTQTGMVLGTPAYMSFEQASGMKSVELDARSDVYSLGVVTYEMLTGRAPFHSDTPVGYLRKHMLEEPPPFGVIAQGLHVPPQVEAVVMKALKKEREERYQSALEFADAFVAAALPAHAADVSRPLQSTKVVVFPAVGEFDARVPPPVTAQPEPKREAARPQPEATVTPAPKTIVPAVAGDTAAAKAVPETARPPRRKWLWSRRKRIGIAASIVWILGAGIYTLKITNDADMRSAAVLERACVEKQIGEDECEQLKQAILGGNLDSERIEAAMNAFVPVALAWGFVYLVPFLVRRFSRRPEAAKPMQFRTISKPSRRAKSFIIAGAALIVIGAGIRFSLQEKAKNGNASWSAKAGESKGEVRVNPNDGLKYVWIPPGTFMMGCSPGDTECSDDEKPSHQVTITKGFWLGQTEVTVRAYRRFAGATGRHMPDEPDSIGRSLNPGWGDEAMPIVNVTWDDAQAYCSWAGGRLPTEAEREYAARAGSSASRYGDLDEIAWYADNSGRQRLDSDRIWEEKDYYQRLHENGNGMHEVGQKRANGFGLYDMLGNVFEWVNDWHEKNYYQNSPSQDPAGPTSGEERVVRGGSWNLNPRFVRVSFRSCFPPALRNFFSGFRCGGEVSGP